MGNGDLSSIASRATWQPFLDLQTKSKSIQSVLGKLRQRFLLCTFADVARLMFHLLSIWRKDVKLYFPMKLWPKRGFEPRSGSEIFRQHNSIPCIP